MADSASPMDSLRLMLKAGIRDFKKTAALFPSSPVLVRHVVAPLGLERCRLAVEFGVGTGVVTEAMLRRLPASGRLLAFELNESLAAFTRARIRDPRLEIVTRGAEFLLEELKSRGLGRADAIASSLGLSLMPERLRHSIFEASVAGLKARGTMAQFIYIHGAAIPYSEFDGKLQAFPALDFLSGYFRKVERDWVFRNVPPAFVYTCCGPIRRAPRVRGS